VAGPWSVDYSTRRRANRNTPPPDSVLTAPTWLGLALPGFVRRDDAAWGDVGCFGSGAVVRG